MYSGGGTSSFSNGTTGNYDYMLYTKCMILGQIGNNIYIVNSSRYGIYYYNGSSLNPTYIEVEDKDAILDYIPESWLLYMNDTIGTARYIFCYNHDTLVSLGIEKD